MSRKPLSILIAGQGIAGSSLALMLARHPSFDPRPNITIVERSQTPRTTGQAIDIRGPAVRVIRVLGLEDKIKQRHTTETGMAIVGAKGQQIACFDATGSTSSTTSEYEILRGELAALLLKNLQTAHDANRANSRVIYGESIQSLKERDDGVAVQFANGKLVPQTFDVVVAADGMSSTTRPMIFPEYAAEDPIKPLGQYMAFFSVPRVADDTDLWRWHIAPRGLGIHIRPHRTKTTMGVYFVINNSKKARIPEVDQVLVKDVAAQKAYLRAKFAGVGFQSARFLDAMDYADDFYMQQTAQVETPKWSSGRCVLLGDAAYCMMGIGTSLSLIGAYLIAGELANAASRDLDLAAALSRYEDLLRPLVANYLKLQSGPEHVIPQSRLGIAVMHSALRVLTWTGLQHLILPREPSGNDWGLPDYGFEEIGE
ncbi:FAD/NAD(P)-binding domain-containing protein [Hyaloscypha variabilis F]|uniref:FAD/NAD(P)-binding domain-containing protein n=1 Tax=Hyaloscypha variabilis (strain UAMH 11265 / GT02V1 / F) TaxID=1149755 RepID=A0A2J6S4I4_HYAVF|nr:FAD/NAD(P)-binding domain-containing protein [Hyaloscypha variabilis F]